MTEVLEVATQLLEEQRLLAGAVRSWEKQGGAMRAEMEDWLEMPAPALPEDEWSRLAKDEE